MNPKISRFLVAAFFGLVAAPGFAAEPAIIAKARARLAPDAVLDAVRSVHYVGTIEYPDPADPKKIVRSAIEFYIAKPDRQRIVITTDKQQEISVLDGYEGWHRMTDLKSNQWKENILQPAEVKQQRADVWENLGYFRGIEKLGGRVADQGLVKVDGVDCEKIVFTHDQQNIYYRYFDRATGKLVFSGTEENGIKEDGEIVADGIRFPHTMTIIRRINGQKNVQVITFDKITVNEVFPNSLFDAPLPFAVPR